MKFRFKRHPRALIDLGVAKANVGFSSWRGVTRISMGHSGGGVFLFIHGLGDAPLAEVMVQRSAA